MKQKTVGQNHVDAGEQSRPMDGDSAADLIRVARRIHYSITPTQVRNARLRVKRGVSHGGVLIRCDDFLDLFDLVEATFQDDSDE